MRLIADMYSGTANTYETDAFIIAEVARTMPHTLRGFQVLDEDEVTPGVLPVSIWNCPGRSPRPATESAGCSLKSTRSGASAGTLAGTHNAAREVLATCPTPAKLQRAWVTRIDAKLQKHSSRRHTARAAQ